ncbi:MAG TPA: NADH-quinone oxidoreductase subunit L [Planctomycetota bacterium]|nr:NADH-quinone oxidoreductase subunit L [Planctomycetota bacterium]
MPPGFGHADLLRLAAIPLLPLVAFFVQTLLGRFGPRKGDWIPVLALGIAAVLGVVEFGKVIIQKPWDPAFRAEWPGLFDWIPGAAGAKASFGILYDNLSATMTAAVGLVAFLIHLFSVGYMHGDRRYASFFAHLSLFSFGMLGLVLSDNFVSFFVCWEVMGLCSYLLIGHFSEKPSAAAACKKAFLTTRIGDVCLFLGIAILWTRLGTFRFTELWEAVPRVLAENGGAYPGWLVAAGLLIFGGAVGKSAQFPLHVWLPDAMEGPTPVSAMIHAATMVAAGVFLTARAFLFLSPEARLVVALVGSFTAIFAATIGICQTDIKRVLAYSTVSQLGYMIAGIGVGGIAAGLFHMITHATFKACLFLGSGSVIHAVHTQEMPQMGGLRRRMPITYGTMLVSTLAIAGVPLFAGFYSKDAILGSVLAHAMERRSLVDALPAIFLFVAAGMTAFYMFRLLILTFHGAPRDRHAFEHAHESPPVMTIPLFILAFFALSGGWLFGRSWFLQLGKGLPGMVEPTGHAAEVEHEAHGLALGGSLLAAGLGILLAFAFYQWKKLSAAAWAQRWGAVHRCVKNKYYVDEFYLATVVPLVLGLTAVQRWFDVRIVDGLVDGAGALGRLGAAISGWFDRWVVDGAVNLVGWLTQLWGGVARLFQTGRIQTYVAFGVAGAVAAAALVLMA